MRLLELLRIFRTIADLPDFTDREATRTWLLKLCDVAKLLTEQTPTPADDAIVAFLERSISDPKLFDPIYDLLVALLGAEDGESQKVGLTPMLAGEAEKVGIDPVTIMAIIEAVAALVKLIRDRRGK